MVSELQKFIDKDKVLFGMRECKKHSKKLELAYAPSDARSLVINELKKSGVEVEFLDLGKEELAEKLELGFMCEVFGVKK